MIFWAGWNDILACSSFSRILSALSRSSLSLVDSLSSADSSSVAIGWWLITDREVCTGDER